MNIFNVVDIENETVIFSVEIVEETPYGILPAELIKNTPEQFKNKSIRFELLHSEEKIIFEPFVLEYIASSDDDII